MASYKTSIFLMSCVFVFGAQDTSWSNPNQINSGYWALHIPFDLEPFETLGGRSLGMGNAFIAIADDSTAAVINPAGLTEIQRMEFTADLRYSSYKTDYLDTYAASNNLGLGPDLEEIGTFDNDITDFSFIGLTLPLVSGRMAASLYYKNSSFEAADVQDVGPVSILDETLNLQQQNISRKEIDEYQKGVFGLAGAVNYDGFFSVGATVNLEQLNAGLSEQWTSNDFSNNTLEATTEYENRIEGDDTDITFAIGALYKPVQGISIGVSYRKGANFSIAYTSTETICDPLSVCDRISEDDNVTFDIPDVWGAGIAWKTLDGWLFSAQVDMVEYSALQDSTTEGITMDETIDDGLIFRFGVEKSFYRANSSQYQLRAGMFSVPDHDGFQAIDSDRMYYTLGGGVTLSKQIELNVGTSFSEDMIDTLLSFSYNF
ncbi:Long-chain fatty acid transport protein [Candidatus Electrothrix aarhusensis]|jgi:long-subunit fatty acid transport protein